VLSHSFVQQLLLEKIMQQVNSKSWRLNRQINLSVIMQDGLWGLNPFRIILSILRTFFKYSCVVCVFYLPIAIIACFIIFFLRNSNAFTFLLFQAVQVYLLFVASHILGRFYYKNEERLGWF